MAATETVALPQSLQHGSGKARRRCFDKGSFPEINRFQPVSRYKISAVHCQLRKHRGIGKERPASGQPARGFRTHDSGRGRSLGADFLKSGQAQAFQLLPPDDADLETGQVKLVPLRLNDDFDAPVPSQGLRLRGQTIDRTDSQQLDGPGQCQPWATAMAARIPV